MKIDKVFVQNLVDFFNDGFPFVAEPSEIPEPKFDKAERFIPLVSQYRGHIALSARTIVSLPQTH